jgi:hypothetical protein
VAGSIADPFRQTVSFCGKIPVFSAIRPLTPIHLAGGRGSARCENTMPSRSLARQLICLAWGGAVPGMACARVQNSQAQCN